MKSRILMAFLASCSFVAFTSVHAQNERRAFDLEKFHSIGLGISANVYLVPGNTQKVEVEGPRDILDLLKRDVRGGSWEIGFTERNVRNYGKLNIYVTLPEVRDLSIGGSGKIFTEKPFDGMDDLTFSIGGSGAIEFAGTARKLDVSIGGSGSVKAEKLKVEDCEVSIGGSGSAYVEVSENLDVSIAGSGDVVYGGRPRVRSSIAGSGKVRGN